MALKRIGRHTPFAQNHARLTRVQPGGAPLCDLREKPLHNRIFSSVDVLEINFESSMAGT